jgi:hypothetical protein
MVGLDLSAALLIKEKFAPLPETKKGFSYGEK